jgi:hypothetical protein
MPALVAPSSEIPIDSAGACDLVLRISRGSVYYLTRPMRSGDYRVNFRDGNETTAYYTANLEDAVNTAVEVARSGSRPRDHEVDYGVYLFSVV